MTEEEWTAWQERREVLRKKHRVMTIAEYQAWIRSGDSLSNPVQGNAFPGGLTITFGDSDGYLGRIVDDPKDVP